MGNKSIGLVICDVFQTAFVTGCISSDLKLKILKSEFNLCTTMQPRISGGNGEEGNDSFCYGRKGPGRCPGETHMI